MILSELRCHIPMPKSYKYALTEWRKAPDHVGAYLVLFFENAIQTIWTV